MKKYIKIVSAIIAILALVTIPLLFLVKYDIYKPCLIFQKNGHKYLSLDKKTYQELTNPKKVVIKNYNNTHYIKISSWKYDVSYNMWYSKIKLSNDVINQEYEILTKQINLLGF